MELSKTRRKVWHVIDSFLADVTLIGARIECFGELYIIPSMLQPYETYILYICRTSSSAFFFRFHRSGCSFPPIVPRRLPSCRFRSP